MHPAHNFQSLHKSAAEGGYSMKSHEHPWLTYSCTPEAVQSMTCIHASLQMVETADAIMFVSWTSLTGRLHEHLSFSRNVIKCWRPQVREVLQQQTK